MNGVVGFILRIQHPPAPQYIVHHDQSAGPQNRQNRVEVIQVIYLVGVDERHVKSFIKTADGIECIPLQQGDLMAVGTFREVPFGDGDGRRVFVAGEQASVLRQALGHRQRAVAAEGADFQNAARAQKLCLQFEKTPDRPPRNHLRIFQAFIGFLLQTGQQFAFVLGMLVNVLLDFFIYEFHKLLMSSFQ